MSSNSETAMTKYAKYIITVDRKDRKEMEHLMNTPNYVFIKEWGDESVIVQCIEPMEDAQELDMNVEVRMIPVKRIHPNPNNPRHEAGDVSSLSFSIREEDLKQPLIVIPAPQHGVGHFMIEDGYRRFVAGSKVRESLLCHINYPAPEENLALRAIFTGLITDGHKEHLPHMDRAEAYGRLRDEFGLTQAEISEKTGFSDTTISRYLNLLELSDKLQNRVRNGTLSFDAAVNIVVKYRKQERKKSGKKAIDHTWDPDNFSQQHVLAKKAKILCDAREHSGHRRFAGACHACWEMAIRQDQSRIDSVDYGRTGVFSPFVPISPDGAIRTDATPNGIKRGV